MSLTGAVAGLATNYVTSRLKRKQELDNLKEKKKLASKQYERSVGFSPAEASEMARLRKGSKEGSIDVGEATSQVAQPIYQQGEAQEATELQNVTAQGLEGSIIAQETSSKIGSDVRAEIATQARNIAVQNEKTKLDAKKALQDNVIKRADLLRNLAFKRQDELAGFKTERRGIEQDFTSGMVGSVLGTLTGEKLTENWEKAGKWLKGKIEEIGK